MQLPNLGRQRGFRRADLTVFSISSWNLARFPSKFLHIFKVSSAFHCILHLNIRFILSAMHKRRGKLSKKLFWAPKYTLSQITQEPLLVILWDFLWRLRALFVMYSTQKSVTFAVVEARNAPCPMEWGCPKDRSMTVCIPRLASRLPSVLGTPSVSIPAYLYIPVSFTVTSTEVRVRLCHPGRVLVLLAYVLRLSRCPANPSLTILTINRIGYNWNGTLYEPPWVSMLNLLKVV